MKRTFLSLLVLIPSLLLAQPEAWELESRLAGTSGRQRLEVLAELAATLGERQPKRAVAFGNEAIELLASLPDEALELSVSTSLCAALRRLGRFEEALELGARAGRLAAETDRQPELVAALLSLGEVHRDRGDLERALDSFRRSLRLARQIGERRGIADNLLHIGRIHLREGRLEAAAETLRRALLAASEIDAADTLREVNFSLAESYAAMGRYREAYGALRRHAELAREASEARAAEAAAELEARLESERRAREIETSEQRRTIGEQQRRIGALERRAGSLTLLALAGGVVLLLPLLWSLYDRHRQKTRSSRALEEKDVELLRTRAELQRTAGELEVASDERDRASRDLARASDELERTSEKLKRASEELERTSADLDRASIQLEQKSGQLERASNQLEKTSEERQRTSRELDRTAAELDRTSRALEQTSKELAHASGKIDRLEERYRRTTSELQGANAAARGRIAEMERFTSTVSQHLKVLLINIRIFLGALRQDADAGDVEQLKKDVDRVYAAIGRMVRLLDGVLKLLLVGRVVHEPEEVSMSELAFEAVGRAAGLTANRRAEVVIAPEMPVVSGDRSQLLQVLEELLENGAKFMGDQATPRLEVASRPEGPVFFVRDNGIGIEPHDHDRVFTLFERLDPAKDGMGVGLAIVQRIVEVHGGRIWVESEGLGRGSTFCFTLSGSSPGGSRP